MYKFLYITLIIFSLLITGCSKKIDISTMGNLDNKNQSQQESLNYTGKLLAGSTTSFYDFNNDDYKKALKENKNIVLYFYADWCPICREEIEKLYSAFNQLDAPDVIGFRVNYNDDFTDEHEKALARQFGIAYQHTKIFIHEGERILKSLESWDTQRYLNEIKNNF